MKKFNYKLEALKQLKDFNEHKVKIEIGKVNREIAQIKEKLAQCDLHLSESYDSHQSVAEEGSSARLMSFYPLFTEGKNAQIQKYKNILYSLEKKYDALLEELRGKRAEAKLMAEMKEKAKTKFKKELNKKQEIEIQDNFLITKGKS